MRANNLRRLLLFLFICLTPFQDTILQATPLQGLGSSFAIIPLFGLLSLSCVDWLKHGSFRIPRIALLIACYATVICMFGLAWFGLTSMGANNIWETVKLSIDTLLVLYVIFGIDYSNRLVLRLAVQIAFFLTIFSILLNDINIFGLHWITDNPLFHQTLNEDLRWRGVTSESGHLAVLIMDLGLLSAYFSKTNAAKCMYWVLALSATVAGGSKGGFLCMLGILAIISVRGKISMQKSIAMIIGIIPIAYFGSIFLMAQMSGDILVTSTTFATRLAMLVWSSLVIVHFPFGVGFSGYLGAMQRYLLPATDIAKQIVPLPLNYGEVLDYQFSPANASAKSALANYVAFFGVPFIILSVTYFRRILTTLFTLNSVPLLACTLFTLLALSTYYDSVVTYNAYVVLGMAVYEYRQIKNSPRST